MWSTKTVRVSLKVSVQISLEIRRDKGSRDLPVGPVLKQQVNKMMKVKRINLLIEFQKLQAVFKVVSILDLELLALTLLRKVIQFTLRQS